MTLAAQPLFISVATFPGGTTLTVRGEVDIATATQLRDAVLRHLTTTRSLSLDLEGVHLHGQLRAPRTDRMPTTGRLARSLTHHRPGLGSR